MSWASASEMKCWNNKLRSLFGFSAAPPTENGLLSFGLHHLVFTPFKPATRPRGHLITGKIPLFYSPSENSFKEKDFDRLHDYILDAFKRAGIGNPSVEVRGDECWMDLDLLFSSPHICPKPSMEDRARKVLAELDTMGLRAHVDFTRRKVREMNRVFASLEQ